MAMSCDFLDMAPEKTMPCMSSTFQACKNKKKGFALSAPAAWEGALVQLSTLVSCVLAVCLAVYRARVPTWAERGGEREGN